MLTIEEHNVLSDPFNLSREALRYRYYRTQRSQVDREMFEVIDDQEDFIGEKLASWPEPIMGDDLDKDW